MTLANKNALVTGAGQGIGKGCALEMARRGADLVINDLGGDEVHKVAEQIRGLGRRCTVIESDVFSAPGREALVRQAIELTGPIHVLVSNPAFNRRSAFLDCALSDFEKVIGATLTSGFHLSQLVTRHMVQRGGKGKVIFISSVHAHGPYALSVGYNGAKAGLNHVARTIAAELCSYRINVNVIEPGWINTPGEREEFGEEYLAKEGAKLPWGRMGEPEDIGKAAAFLASDDADYITGTVLRVDGGFVLKGCSADLPTETDDTP